MLKVLITGANGQLGQSFKSLQSTALARGISLFFADRQTLDITNLQAIGSYLAGHSIEIVINTAAYTGVDAAEEHHHEAQLINAQGAENLARSCTENAAWLIQISTDYVFNGATKKGYLESDKVDPLGVYGQTKLAGEQLVEKYHPQALILRTSWVFSEFGNNFLKTMLRLGRERDELSIVADQRGGPSYAPHIAEVVFKLIDRRQQLGELSGIFHFSGSPETCWSHFAEHIFSAGERIASEFTAPVIHPITTSEYPTAAARPQNSSLDCTKLYSTIGAQSYMWEEGIERSISALVKDQRFLL